MSLSSVNLLWQKRFRGLGAASGHNVDASGNALLIKPDELERRTYQVLSIDPQGEARELLAVSVETVRKWDVSPDGKLLLGMTADDIYLWRGGRKVRFTPDTRVVYADACLAPEAGCFVAASSDALFSAHAVTLGDAGGRLGWTKDLESAVNRVAVAGDGQTVAIGMQDGRILALDSRRSLAWECVQGEPVSALAMPVIGPRAAAGTEDGSVLALDEEGGFRWRNSVGLPVVALAVDAEAQWIAAALTDGRTHLLSCFGPDGSLIWEWEPEAAPTGVSLSPGGRHLLVTQGNGVALLFELDLVAGAGMALGARRDGELASARADLEAGEPAKARERLQALVQAAPHDVEAARELMEAERILVIDRREVASELAAAGKWRAALETLGAAAQIDPWSEELFRLRLEYRRQAVEAAAEQARSLRDEADWEGAARAWTEALALDPGIMDARAALGEIRRTRATELMERGDERSEAGETAAAVELWQEARRLEPSEELEDRLRRAEVQRCVEAGVAHYDAGRMAEAQFQLKKALALDPGNETAERYLGYAQGQTGASGISDRFSRLE